MVHLNFHIYGLSWISSHIDTLRTFACGCTVMLISDPRVSTAIAAAVKEYDMAKEERALHEATSGRKPKKKKLVQDDERQPCHNPTSNSLCANQSRSDCLRSELLGGLA